MAENEYHFVDSRRVEGDVKEVADILEDALALPRWWGSVYFDVKQVEPGGEGGIGKLISLHARAWLPYTLRIDFRTIASIYPHGFSMDATGDLRAECHDLCERAGRSSHKCVRRLASVNQQTARRSSPDTTTSANLS